MADVPASSNLIRLPVRIVKLHRYIAGSLWIGGLLLVVVLVAAALWGILWQAGDEAGAQGAKGVFLVALACWILDFIGLVVLVALAQIAAERHDTDGEVR